MSRGMKQYLPFKSLHEQGDALSQLFYRRYKQEKPILSANQAAVIDEFLRAYRGEKIIITYFIDGYQKCLETKIKKIDVVYQKLILSDHTIAFSDILKLEKV